MKILLGNRQDQDTLNKGKKLTKNKEKTHVLKILPTLLVNKAREKKHHDSQKGLLLKDLEKLKCLVLVSLYNSDLGRKHTVHTGEEAFLTRPSLTRRDP